MKILIFIILTANISVANIIYNCKLVKTLAINKKIGSPDKDESFKIDSATNEITNGFTIVFNKNNTTVRDEIGEYELDKLDENLYIDRKVPSTNLVSIWTILNKNKVTDKNEKTYVVINSNRNVGEVVNARTAVYKCN